MGIPERRGISLEEKEWKRKLYHQTETTTREAPNGGHGEIGKAFNTPTAPNSQSCGPAVLRHPAPFAVPEEAARPRLLAVSRDSAAPASMSAAFSPIMIVGTLRVARRIVRHHRRIRDAQILDAVNAQLRVDHRASDRPPRPCDTSPADDAGARCSGAGAPRSPRRCARSGPGSSSLEMTSRKGVCA